MDDVNLDPLPDLPDELAELDAELRDIRLAERPSFGPELEAELERAWSEDPSPSESPVAGRLVLAASIGAVLFAGTMVPSARAAIAEISRQSMRLIGVEGGIQASTPVTEPESLPLPLLALGADGRRGEAADEVRTSPPVRGSHDAGLEVGAARPVEPSAERLPLRATVGATQPVLADRREVDAAIRRYYPPDLEERGIGGSVVVRLDVDISGGVDGVEVVGSSGYPRMDAAGIRAARGLQFRPGTRDGEAVGMRSELEMVFEPLPAERLPMLVPVEQPILPEDLDADLPGLWPYEAAATPRHEVKGREALRAALGRPSDLERRFGSVEHLLAGEPPAGVSPLRWRYMAGAALEEALEQDPGNPAPYLALGRIRKRQGYRSDALALFEEGAERATLGSTTVSPLLVAELNYERGLVLKDAWLGSRDLGRIAPESLESARCSAGRAGGSLVEDLIGLNYLCFAELARVLRETFEPVVLEDDPHGRMIGMFRAAVAADPAHVAANVELLLDRADEGAWLEMLNGARSFAWASRGHPRALLLSGLALHRMGRSEEAMEDFALAARALPPEELELLRDIGPLVSPAERKAMAVLPESEREARIRDFWRSREPLYLTEVNEREVEHLARTTYALLRLGGPSSESGEVWVRYGRPAAVRAFGEGTGLRTEFWDYGPGPAVTFQRPALTSDLSLTPEARAYLDDLGATLPHRWSRPSADLDAQVVRFRSRGTAPATVAAHGRVPAQLATGPTDSLQAGLFVLGSDGSVLSKVVRRIPAMERPVRMEAPVPERADRFVLELNHPDPGVTGAVRSAVVREDVFGEDSRISDLVITEPASSPTRHILRDEPWLIPRPDRDDLSGSSVGLLFELYGAGPDTGPYTMRVELEPRAGGEPIDLPVRPSGENRFAKAWPRTPVDAPEFLTLDLGDVASGTYTLRLIVDRAPGGGAVVAEKTVRR